MADVFVINKVDAASANDVRVAEDEVRAVNPTAIDHALQPRRSNWTMRPP